jgi:hypothetical protein
MYPAEEGKIKEFNSRLLQRNELFANRNKEKMQYPVSTDLSLF